MAQTPQRPQRGKFEARFQSAGPMTNKIQAEIKNPRARTDWKAGTVSKSRYSSNYQAIVSGYYFRKLTGYNQLQVEAERGGVEGGSQSSISDAIFPELLNEQFSKYDRFMGSADVLVPEKILERP